MNKMHLASPLHYSAQYLFIPVKEVSFVKPGDLVDLH
jgi:hypothetical protein